MSRTSEYTSESIREKSEEKGFIYVEGENHVNGGSSHLLRCKFCNGLQWKKSRYIVNKDKGGCAYFPCNPRGLLTVARVQSVAVNENITVKFPFEITDAFSQVVNPEVELLWVRDEFEMAGSWNYVHGRIRKGYPIFSSIYARSTKKRTRVPVKGRIANASDAVKAIVVSGCTSWGVLTSRKPALAREIEGCGYKDEIFLSMGWLARNEFSACSDDELLSRALQIFNSEGLKTIGELERFSSGVVKNLRERNLIGIFSSLADIHLKSSWRHLTFDEMVNLVKDEGFLSLTEWHATQAGSYKYANEMDWVKGISNMLGWGKYKDKNGNGWMSKGEVRVANILIELGIEFEGAVRIPNMVGLMGGVCFTDFYLPAKDLWIEVWGYFSSSSPAREQYKKSRAHKTSQYYGNKMKLCGIEGAVLYKEMEVEGVKLEKGEKSFDSYVISMLSKFDVIDGSLKF